MDELPRILMTLSLSSSSRPMTTTSHGNRAAGTADDGVQLQHKPPPTSASNGADGGGDGSGNSRSSTATPAPAAAGFACCRVPASAAGTSGCTTCSS
jgi:hypothetical protein